jgi:Hemerythrin HHE cation binding domain
MEEQTNNLVDILTQDHDHIGNLMRKFAAMQSNDMGTDISLLQEIKWAILKHIYLEEKMLFNFCDMTEEFDFNYINELLQEHDKIMDLLKGFENNKETESYNIQPLFELIEKHKITEIEKYYNKMDEFLDESQKSTVIVGIHKPASSGFYPIEKLREYGLSKMKNSCGPVDLN